VSVRIKTDIGTGNIHRKVKTAIAVEDIETTENTPTGSVLLALVQIAEKVDADSLHQRATVTTVRKGDAQILEIDIVDSLEITKIPEATIRAWKTTPWWNEVSERI
jgi:hypothetical protein